MEQFTWALTALSIIGTVMNIRKDRRCFWVWLFTNGAWAVYDFSIGAIAQAALFFVYFCLAIWGIIEWKKEKPGEGRVENRD